MQRRDESEQFQIGPALVAGLIAGVVLLLVPRGSPWSVFTFSSPMIMGRVASPFLDLPLPAIWTIHLGVSLVYSVLISAVVSRWHRARAILAGAVMGAVLYLLNAGVVAIVWPEWRSSQFAVVFTHIVFGLIASACYRGLLSRRSRRIPASSIP